ncbi:MAG: DUF1428 family protein [Ignavibacteria bacterium]|nr:DUF1428 family protein [Ignavibacteria bacterium]
MKKAKGYVTCFLMVVPKKNMSAYKKIAKMFGEIVEKYGALEYREFVQDDLPPKLYPALMKTKKNEVIITSIIGYKNKKHKDQVTKKVMNDEKMKAMMNMKPLFDMSKMMYGGFKTFIEM